ncbi:MAG: sulfatase-like hydrolase/transferase [Granulosicoccus sp.]|nr:sulfatase-like hydrolase/transferase [Granulosicoccus sp.]
MSDEHQARALGCADHAWIKTPHLDTLAERGTRFENAYTPSPICVPARAAFATGRLVNKIRLWDNAMPYVGGIPGWGHALQKADIPVHSIGKLHYRHESDPTGFDKEHMPMMVADGVGMVWASIRDEAERASPPSRMLGQYIGPGHSNYTQYDAAVTDRTIQWLQQDAKDLGSPWCLFVGLVAPHFPLVVPQPFYDLYPADLLPEPKLHPSEGYQRHPWVEKQNAYMDSESNFENDAEKRSALASYYGLCSYLDDNIGKILRALDETHLTENTTIIYTSDHGDNAGARGLWGKSNLYEESSAIPLIMAGPGIPVGVCHTPVSLIDVSVSIASHFNQSIDTDEEHGPAQGKALKTVLNNPDQDRLIFSEYHAAGAVSGAYMVRVGRWKYIHYVGFEPELFDLENDPEELHDVAGLPANAAVIQTLHAKLSSICDPEATNQQALDDQAALVESYGGLKKALTLGAPGATPPPELNPDDA